MQKKGPLRIRLSKIFESIIYQASLNIHLYFVKLFGCRIVEESIPIDVGSFSDSILNNKPNPYVFIVFKKAIGSKLQTATITPVHAELNEDKVVVAAWMYTVGDLNIEILYSPCSAHNEFLKKSFHPQRQHKLINFIDFEDDESES